jgi:hypothetical protein
MQLNLERFPSCPVEWTKIAEKIFIVKFYGRCAVRNVGTQGLKKSKRKAWLLRNSVARLASTALRSDAGHCRGDAGDAGHCSGGEGPACRRAKAEPLDAGLFLKLQAYKFLLEIVRRTFFWTECSFYKTETGVR